MARGLIALLGLGVALIASLPAVAAPLGRLEYRDDLLTLRAEDTPLPDVMDALKRQSGAELRGVAPDAHVSADLDAVPLRDALQRLLGEQSFTLTYGDDGHLKTIELKGGPTLAKARAEPEPAAKKHGDRDAGKGPARWQAIGNAFTDGGPIPVTGRLREVAGADTASWDFVLRMASSQDPTVRAEAIRTGVRAVETDDDMRAGVLGVLRTMDDEELAAFVRAVAGSVNTDPEALAKEIARASRTGEVRSRAHDLIRQLRVDQRAAAGTT